MSSTFSPTPGELAIVNQLFAQNDPQKFGIITGEVAVKIFGGAKLSSTTLGKIWSIADAENNGFLTRKGVAVAVRLMGWAQKGDDVSEELINKPGPLPVLEGLSQIPAQRAAPSPSPRSPPPPALPPLTTMDRAKFNRLFVSCGPVNGLLNGEKARDVFVKSKLSVEKLSQIWNLSDTQSRGSLDATDFSIAMYLIQLSMSGQLSSIPTTLPPGLYEQAAGRSDGVIAHATGGSGSLSPTLTGSFPPRSATSAIQPQYTGQTVQQHFTGQPLPQQYTGSAFKVAPTIPPRPAPAVPPFPVPPTAHVPQWDVTPAEKASSDRFFDTLDSQKKGYIEGDVAVPFMLQSKLAEDALAQVWDLADLNNDGRLTRDGFAVAMHLIQGKLTGKDIPTSLPTSLVPPSMRTNGVAASPFQTQQPQQSETIRDLLWDETPPPSAITPQPVQHQQTGSLHVSPSAFSTPFLSTQQASAVAQDPFGGSTNTKDLMGDDDDAGATSPPIHDHSAEIGNVQNQLDSTKRSLETTKAERTSIEATIANQAAQLSALQTQLSSAKAAYETETRLLAALRERYTNQTTDINKAREELIHAESDLSAVRVEKSEIEQHLLRDKEEVRDLQRKMTEAGSTIEHVKVEIEKAKKDAKQQKGLLAIAKKQLATRETERAKIEKELEEANAEALAAAKEREEAETLFSKETPAAPFANDAQTTMSPSVDSLAFAAAQPLPATPGSPGSIMSGSGSKSNNPFERLVMSHTGSSTRSQSPFLPFTNASVLTPLVAPPPPNGTGTVTDDPFSLAFGTEEPTNVPSSGLTTDVGAEPRSLTPKPPSINANVTSTDEVSSPLSDNDMFSTPPTTAVPVLAQHSGSVSQAGSFPGVEATLSQFPPAEAFSSQPPAAHEPETDLNAPLKEIDIDESDSSDDDTEDSQPFATLVKRASNIPPAPQEPAAATNGVTGASNAGFSFDDAFVAPSGPETQAAPPLPQSLEKELPPTSQATIPFDSFADTHVPPGIETVLESPLKAPAGVSDFDEAMGKIPSSASGTSDPTFTFDNSFDDNFDFGAASGTAFPPAPSSNGSAAPAPFLAIAPAPAPALKNDGFDSVFAPQVSAQLPSLTSPPQAPPAQIAPSLSFDDAFGSASFATQSQPSQPSASSDAHGISFDDAFGGVGPSQALALDNNFGTASSRASFVPPQTQSPTGATPFPTASPPRDSSSSYNASRMSASPPIRATSPPPRVSSPKLRPSTASSSKDGHEKKEPVRHSKLSIRLPFGKKKKTMEPAPLPPSQLSQHLSPLPEPAAVGTTTPAVEDDVEPVKQLSAMGFSRSQAVAALEANAYDFQKALNSLLGSQ